MNRGGTLEGSGLVWNSSVRGRVLGVMGSPVGRLGQIEARDRGASM